MYIHSAGYMYNIPSSININIVCRNILFFLETGQNIIHFYKENRCTVAYQYYIYKGGAHSADRTKEMIVRTRFPCVQGRYTADLECVRGYSLLEIDAYVYIVLTLTNICLIFVYGFNNCIFTQKSTVASSRRNNF